MTRFFIVGMCLGMLVGCSSRRGDRLKYEESRRTQIMDESTSLELRGGTFITVQSTLSQTNERQITKFVIRAESLNPSIRIETVDCQPQVLHFEVLNTNTDSCEYEAFRLGEHAVDEGTRRLLDSLVDVPAPGGETPGTYLVRPNECGFELGEKNQVNLSACIEWSTGRAEVLPGFVEFETCFSQTSRGSCVEDLDGADTAVSSQAIETVITLNQKPVMATVVAAISNVSMRTDDLSTLGESLRSHGADFLVIVGDITSDGTLAEAERVKRLLDTYVTIPWFATLGDKDVGGNLGLEYLGLFGSASLAFEVLGVRFVLLDSASRALKESEVLLDAWLSDTALDGTKKTPVEHLVFTHFPPFEEGGGASKQFAHVVEAGDLVARLTAIDALGLVVGAPEQSGAVRLAGLDVFRVGSTGSPSTLAWTKFQIESTCIQACQESDEPCTCLEHEVIRIER